MRVIKQSRQMAHVAQALRRAGKSIGFVPTMGALHDGHLSLIRAARRETQTVVVSIFVNPLQFGPQEDFERYPRDLKHDLNLAKAAGCDLVFAPHASQIYPEDFCTSVQVGEVSDRFEGEARPGHFRGVATVVMKLFQLVQPTAAYFGQKDYQQAIIIQRMVKDLNVPVAIRLMPTVREPDGLAMSSRNAYLSHHHRRQAVVVSRALQLAKRRIRAGERDAGRITDELARLVRQESSARIDYVVIVNAKTLEPVRDVRGHVAILVAAWLGSTRLIDNVLVDVP